MSVYSRDVDTGDNFIYPEGIITIRNNDLCMYCMTQTEPYIPEGIITIRDSDLCLYYVTQTGPTYNL